MNVTHVLRTYLGLTQMELAKMAGITQPDLSEIEQKPPYGFPAKYQRLSATLGVPVEALLKDDFTAIPESFFDLHPEPEYTPVPSSPELTLGRMGEEYILQREQDRLKRSYPALAKLVIPFFKRKGAFCGYDILSFDDNGLPVCLEVKTSEYCSSNFLLTKNEMDAALKLIQMGEQYHIVAITGWGSDNLSVCDIPFSKLEEDYKITPYRYLCHPVCQRNRETLNGIAYHRRQQGLTQAALAQRLGLIPCDLSLYETGARQGSVGLYLKASEVLGVTVDELLAEYDCSPAIDVG